MPGIHRAPHTALWNMGPRLRGDDSRSVWRAYRLRQLVEHPRQIDLDRARVDVEHAIAALAQPRPPLGTRLDRGRAFVRGHNIDDQPQRERDEVGDVRPDRDLALDAFACK